MRRFFELTCIKYFKILLLWITATTNRSRIYVSGAGRAETFTTSECNLRPIFPYISFVHVDQIGVKSRRVTGLKGCFSLSGYFFNFRKTCVCHFQILEDILSETTLEISDEGCTFVTQEKLIHVIQL